jgi:hypothetical protein
MPILLDAEPSFDEQCGSLIITKEQEITPEFLDRCRADREYSATHRAGEMHRAASVPTIVVELWKRQGFDVMTAPARDILARLRREGLDNFITTSKTV